MQNLPRLLPSADGGHSVPPLREQPLQRPPGNGIVIGDENAKGHETDLFQVPLSLEAPHSRNPFQALQQLLGRKRLDKKIVGAEGFRFLGQRDARSTAADDHRRNGTCLGKLLQLAQHFNAGSARHAHVEHNRVGHVAHDGHPCLDSVIGGKDFEAPLAELAGKHVNQHLVVIGNQYFHAPCSRDFMLNNREKPPISASIAET